MISRTTLALFFSYVVYAGVATLADMSTLYLATEYVHVHYQFSAVLGYFVGMVTNYSLNKRYTFKDGSVRYAKQFTIFAGVALVGLVINQVVLYGLVEYVNLWYMHAKLIAVGVVAVWSFWGHRTFTFCIAR